MYYIKKELLLALLISFTSCTAQDLSADEWVRVDEILFPNHTPVISSEKLRYVPQETQMGFDREIIREWARRAVEHRSITAKMLSARFEENALEFITLSNQINAVTVKKTKSVLSPSWYAYVPVLGWLCDCCMQWTIKRLRDQADALMGAQRGYTHAYVQNQNVLYDLERTKERLDHVSDKQDGNATVVLSGREFAHCARECWHDRGTPLRNQSYWFMNEKIRDCFTVLHTYNAYYNLRGREFDEDSGQTAAFPMHVSYRPFQGMSCRHESFSEEALFLLPYVKQTALYAISYDGYGRPNDWRPENPYESFTNDPRYDADIHGPFGAIFMKSPHEIGYDNTMTGENTTWLRRRSRREAFQDTCDPYINKENKTPGKENFNVMINE
jgi:hypothetical protein